MGFPACKAYIGEIACLELRAVAPFYEGRVCSLIVCADDADLERVSNSDVHQAQPGCKTL